MYYVKFQLNGIKGNNIFKGTLPQALKLFINLHKGKPKIGLVLAQRAVVPVDVFIDSMLKLYKANELKRKIKNDKEK